jgi:hypothetical protein
MLDRRPYEERKDRFGTLESEIAKKMVRQFRTFDGSRGLLPIEAESLAYIALEYLEEHDLLLQPDNDCQDDPE